MKGGSSPAPSSPVSLPVSPSGGDQGGESRAIKVSQPPFSRRDQGGINRDLGGTPDLPQISTFISLSALALLFGRAVAIAGVNISQLALAIGLLGWLLTWLSQQEKKEKNSYPVMERLGAGILSFAWLVSVEEFPLQAIAVSGLALWWLRHRLLTLWRPRDLALIFFIGWQTFTLFGRVIPSSFRQTAIDVLVTPEQSSLSPVLGLTWFPYLLGMLWLTGWLYSENKGKLAQFGDNLAVGFGIFLNLLAFPSPALFTLNLFLSTLTLAIVSYRRYVTNVSLVYLTHIYGLLTIAAGITWQFPRLSYYGWIVILLTLMLLEWIGANLTFNKWKDKLSPSGQSLQIYQRSAWHLGLVLAALSYILLLHDYQATSPNYYSWGLVWLVTPLSLTVIEGINKDIEPRNRLARSGIQHPAWLSIIALVLAQVFTFEQPATRFISLGLATILMLFNTSYVVTAREKEPRESEERKETSPVVSTYSQEQFLLVYLTHIYGLLTIEAGITWQFPSLSSSGWIGIFLTLMLLEWIWANLNFNKWKDKLALSGQLYQIYQHSAWYLGLFLAGLSYILLLHEYEVIPSNFFLSSLLLLLDLVWPSPWSWDLMWYSWSLVWLITPLSLTVIAGINRDRRPKNRLAPPKARQAAWLSIIALILAQLTPSESTSRLISLGVSTVLMLFNTFYLGASKKSRKKKSKTGKTLPLKHHPRVAAAITLGFGLTFLVMLLPKIIPSLTEEGWLIVGSLLPGSLWLWYGLEAGNKQLGNKERFSALVYAPVADGWAKVLAGLQLLILSLHSFFIVGWTGSSMAVVGATVLLLAAIAARTWQRPSNLVIYILGWGLEVLTIEVLGLINLAPISLAMVNIALGLVTQLIGNFWLRHHPNKSVSHSIHILPLFYGAVATACRWNLLAGWTGFSTLGLALIILAGGRGFQPREHVGKSRPQLKIFTYLGLLGISLSAYEFLWIQIKSFPGGDACIAMAALAAAIMSAYRFLVPFLTKQLGLTSQEVKLFAHLHWLGGSVILLLATESAITFNHLLGLETGALLSSYAIFQGREQKVDPLKTIEQQQKPQAIEIQELWVYVGMLEGLGVGLFASYQLQLGGILWPWSGAIATAIASGFYFLPWSNWGWSQKPWRRAAFVIPFMAAVATSSTINSFSLGAIAVCYGIFAVLQRKVRLTYMSLFFLNWLIGHQGFIPDDGLWLVTPPMLSLLYIAQVDPHLKKPKQTSLRHGLRLFATGIICLVALVTTNWLVALSWSILAIFAGLILRVRAFLYIGTLFLLINTCNQFLLLSYEYAFVKWALGLTLGLLFIWIAASFETRQEQIINLLKNWITELDSWQ